jgi:opacity protein-like surface antigen
LVRYLLRTLEILLQVGPVMSPSEMENPMRKLFLSVTCALATLVCANSANAQSATQDINLTADVTSFCTIDGSNTGTVITRAIPVTNGTVGAIPAIPAIASVVCNGPTDVLATSVSGGVTTGVAAPVGFTNTINYTGAATFGTATSTINTATTATAVGSEAGNVASTAAATSGSLTVTITPAQPALPLMVSTAYADTLRVTLTPQ